MKKIFGAKKSRDPPPTIQDATNQINKRGESVDEKIKKLDEELARYKEQIRKARPGPSQEAIKARAIRLLKHKRMYEEQRNMLYNQTYNLDQVGFAADGLKDAQQTMGAMKAANKELKGMMKTVKIEDIDEDELGLPPDQINQEMMQAAVALSAVLPVAVRGRSAARRSSATVAGGGRRTVGAGVRASAAAAPEADYSSSVSVFPMEACDLVGGEACDAQMYPETKLGAGAGGPAAAARAPEVEREYLAYDEPKTVFPDEACDDLGGEFCEAPYQTTK
ncbi:Charged multivesicular body protein 5 [Triticum urartu]|uniref:Charged multivesicular body protein 5 n=2 Tax=Triticum urartu TaxID=4572 RepID=M7ZH96_TRIUA|nr:Charged multivesicular body protein 5 [Triticum urartu]